MAKKKIFLTDEKKKDLEGFEEVLDLITGDTTEIKNEKNVQIEDYEIYDYLEKEGLRLEKLDQFFSVQVPLDKKYAQTEMVKNKVQEDMAMAREELIERLMSETSDLSSFLANLYGQAFST